MQDTIAAEVPFLLEEWGRWARQRGLRLDYARLRQPSDLRGGGLRAPLIADTTALWVDQCVAAVTPQKARDALVLRYVIRAPLRVIARELDCHHSSVQRLVDDGLHQVGEALEG